MSKLITLSLDVMGGDHGPSVVVPAALSFLAKNSDVHLILVGNEEVILTHLPEGKIPQGVSIQHATQQVEMDEAPASALRGKKDSSMRVAINLVKSGDAQACVSAGNTGALMATARFVLKTIPGIDRPAIISTWPSYDGRTWMLDLGANIDSTAEHLKQFAIMASELVTAVEGLEAPRVGLLNIGEEEIKGVESVKQAHKLLSATNLNYIGYVEGNDIYMGSNIDIVVVDGYVGNIALKTSEGLAKMIIGFLKDEFQRNWLTKIAAFIALPVLKQLKNKVDPKKHNGAALLGLRGIVVKSHGGADAISFETAIGVAKEEAHADVISRIADKVQDQLEEKATA